MKSGGGMPPAFTQNQTMSYAAYAHQDRRLLYPHAHPHGGAGVAGTWNGHSSALNSHLHNTTHNTPYDKLTSQDLYTTTTSSTSQSYHHSAHAQTNHGGGAGGGAAGAGGGGAAHVRTYYDNMWYPNPQQSMNSQSPIAPYSFSNIDMINQGVQINNYGPTPGTV